MSSVIHSLFILVNSPSLQLCQFYLLRTQMTKVALNIQKDILLYLRRQYQHLSVHTVNV